MDENDVQAINPTASIRVNICIENFTTQKIFGNVYDYYYSLDDENFIDRVIKCMNVFKATYKVILIELFEEATTKYNKSYAI